MQHTGTWTRLHIMHGHAARAPSAHATMLCIVREGKVQEFMSALSSNKSLAGSWGALQKACASPKAIVRIAQVYTQSRCAIWIISPKQNQHPLARVDHLHGPLGARCPQQAPLGATPGQAVKGAARGRHAHPLNAAPLLPCTHIPDGHLGEQQR